MAPTTWASGIAASGIPFTLSAPSMSSTFCEEYGGHLEELLLDPLARAENRPGECDTQAAATRTEMGRSRLRVQSDDADVLHLEAEVVGHQLRGDRVLPLSLEREAHPDRHRTHDVEAHRGALGHADAGHAHDRIGVPVEDPRLDGAGNADPQVAPLLARLGLLLAQPSVLRHLQHLVERRLVLTAVVLVPARDRVGELIGRDVVPAPHLRGIDLQAARGDVHHLLQDEIVRRRAHAPIGTLGELVGGHQGEIVLSGPDGIGAGKGGQLSPVAPTSTSSTTLRPVTVPSCFTAREAW
jgi:hypothetical protein